MNHKLIDGELLLVTDVGCPNFERARVNREMLKSGIHPGGNYLGEDGVVGSINRWWEIMEESVHHTPARCPLASWIPQNLELYPVNPEGDQ